MKCFLPLTTAKRPQSRRASSACWDRPRDNTRPHRTPSPPRCQAGLTTQHTRKERRAACAAQEPQHPSGRNRDLAGGVVGPAAVQVPRQPWSPSPHLPTAPATDPPSATAAGGGAAPKRGASAPPCPCTPSPSAPASPSWVGAPGARPAGTLRRRRREATAARVRKWQARPRGPATMETRREWRYGSW